LKARLQKEGLFDIAHKKDLPRMPRQIGVITSPTGAAIRDIVSVLGRRFPSIPVLIFPTLVQGEQAADQIVAQINKAVTRGDCDVLILARGGGSLEDLWPFNEEKVARAIHACPIPIVSGVGHEVDFTIADFVADKRAPTPSVAAEMVVPDGQEIVQALERRERQIIHAMRNKLKLHSHHFNQIFKHLQHPSRRLQIITQKVDELESRLTRSTRESLRQYERMLSVLSARLRQHNPAAEIRHQGLHIEQLKKRVINLMRQHLALQKSRLAEHSRGLETVSPLATLSRGYSILRDEKGQILRQSSQTRAGAVVHANLGEGALRLTVDEVMNE
ncbi:MAG: exodeoxyribonuclease VII large subunit, partial [Gammaproteobacteria bacterium]|nr:exodeoxyribonuclease VII large subunit [Gammaproteobacteria bacterium]